MSATGGPAPVRDRIRVQARFELGTLLRNGEQLLVSLVLPMGVLLAVAATDVPDLGEGERIDIATPGVLALCVISAAFTSQAIATGFDRRYQVLRLLGTTPLGRDGLLAGKALATLGVELLQWLLVGTVGVVLGWRPVPLGIACALLLLLLGTWAFVALALLLAGTLRAEGVLALANLVWLILLVLGGVVLPRGEMPPVLQPALAALPSSALADGLRSALGSGAWSWSAALVLLAWAIAATLAARRTFRWSD